MDFSIKKPTHIFAFLILFFTLFILIIYPTMVFLNVVPYSLKDREDVYRIDLDEFVTDNDNTADEISWKVIGNSTISVNLTDNNAEIIVPVSWKGYEKITFIATDLDGYSSSDDFIVYSTEKRMPEVIAGIPDQIILPGKSFEKIDLNEYVDTTYNLSNLTWKYLANTDLTITLVDKTVDAAYTNGWNGSEIITFIATDSEGNSYSDYVIFTVADNPPVVSDLSFDLEKTGDISEFSKLFGAVITIIILVGTPIIWYVFVNKANKKKILSALKMRLDRIDEAFLYGLLAAILMYIIIGIIGMLLYSSGLVQEGDDISNIKDIVGNLSIPSMIFIILFLSTCEEIFFRGFLMEKIGSVAGKNIAIGSTAVLFGLAHIGYGKIYPVIMPIIMGVILGIIVYKTKNLYSAIIAHILFNLVAFVLFLFAQSMNL